MNQLVEECRSEWKRLGVPDPAADEMAAELAADLADAQAEGASVEDVLGIGASGPQVVEGWYGQPFPKPIGRTREFVELVRTMIRREKPVEFQGEHFTIWNELMAVAFVSTLPSLTIFLLFQRYFVKGIVLSGIKG